MDEKQYGREAKRCYMCKAEPSRDITINAFGAGCTNCKNYAERETINPLQVVRRRNRATFKRDAHLWFIRYVQRPLQVAWIKLKKLFSGRV